MEKFVTVGKVIDCTNGNVNRFTKRTEAKHVTDRVRQYDNDQKLKSKRLWSMYTHNVHLFI